MKDFAKSIVCNAKAEVAAIESAVVGNYDPNDYKDNPRHKWTVKSIENEIQKYKRRIELNRVRITQLRNMANDGGYPSAKRELKEEEHDYEANQMKVKQLVSMLRRATGNSIAEVGNEIHDDQINGPAAQEIRETAARVYKKEMREDDLARATAFELAKKYKNFQKSSSFMETIKDVLKNFKTGNSKVEDSGWKQGASGNFEWNVLSFDEPSEYGINNGRISKLFIRDKTTFKVEANYDRGWDVRPSQKVKSLYDELIRKYN